MGIPNADDLTAMTQEADKKELQNWGDRQQYDAEPHQGDPDTGVLPTVKLVWMTPDPLGAMAAFSGIYSGRVVRSLDELTDEDRYQSLVDVQQTHLQAPLEVIKMHFLIEGVDRAFTHQLVRQRTAVYGQESMRFAVLGDLLDATTLPPSLQGTVREPPMREGEERVMGKGNQWQRDVWDETIRYIDRAYHLLVESGMPSEEARGLLPHATATRIHFITDMRNLKDHAGNRLCTQAQFHWRSVFSQMVNEIRNYGQVDTADELPYSWQYAALADSPLWRPVCYQLGHCPFKASFDRACSIRERVDKFASAGVPGTEWHKPHFDHAQGTIPEIHVAEWLVDPSAARI